MTGPLSLYRCAFCERTWPVQSLARACEEKHLEGDE